MLFFVVVGRVNSRKQFHPISHGDVHFFFAVVVGKPNTIGILRAYICCKKEDNQ
jgi:hypothetical protein